MSYDSRVRGEWEINPPLMTSDLRELPDFEWIRVRVEEEQETRGEEVVTRRWGVAVESAREGAWSYYELTDELAKFAAMVQPRWFSGFIVREGEEQGDVERYWWEPRGVFSKRAALRWPDGEQAP